MSRMSQADYVRFYESFKQPLIELYGTPFEDTETWTNELYKDDEYMFNEAVSRGHYEKETIWVSDGYFVILQLTRGLHGGDFVIKYSRDFSPDQ